jgi:tRNA dimethylallyltransferase
MNAERKANEGPPVVVVTGPTATGKTGLAIDLCQRFGGEIVNADSMQVYRYMDIGSAKPSPEERARAPHHLLDVVTPDVEYSAGRYAQEAREVAASIHARGGVVFLTGGTGLYIRAFLDGLVHAGGADPELRERLEREQGEAAAEGDHGWLHRKLAAIDEEAASRIHPNDERRLIRALEIRSRVGELASVVRERHGFSDRPYRVLHLALEIDKPELDERIDRRCEAMIEAGLLREVRALRERGYGAALRPMRAIGYRHLNPVVDGEDTLANALEAMQRDTRRFAKRQRTWLRTVSEAVHVDPQDLAAISERVETFLYTGGAEVG